MPYHKAQEKSIRQDKVRNARNRAVRSRVLTLMKKSAATAQSGDAAAIAKVAKDTQSAIDRAAKKKAIHKNTAARRKSRLARMTAQKKKEQPGA